jgi:hypothetical protein
MKQAALPILVLLVVVTLAIVTTLPSASVEADHYQRFRDGKSLYTLLSGSIGRGYSLQDVEELLGPGVPFENDIEAHRAALRETAQWQPSLYPDGIYDADTFKTWLGNDEKVTLQFRNEYLVNYSPEQFTTFQPSYDLAGHAPQDDDVESEPRIEIAGREISPIPLIPTKPTSVNATTN